MPEFVLPPLQHRQIRQKGQFETWLDGLLIRAASEPTSWWWIAARWLVYVFALYVLVIAPILGEQISLTHWLIDILIFGAVIAYLKPSFLRQLARLTLYFGRTFPYVARPFYWLAKFMRTHVLANIKVETARTVFLRRLFSLERVDHPFNTRYAVINWVSVLIFVWLVPGDLIEGAYAYGTYPFGTYADVVVTQAYPKQQTFALQGNQNTYAIHGNITLPDGGVKEVYLTLGPNIWFWELLPEFVFGQIPVNGRCTFYTYGWMIRIPARLRLFSAGSLYVINPWIVGIKDGHCASPTNVPPPK